MYFASLFQVEPYLMRSNKRGVEFEGYIADLVQQIARVLSVDYEWRVQRRVGRKRKDGTWNGMIGELTEGVRNDFLIYDILRNALFTIYDLFRHQANSPPNINNLFATDD